MLLNFEYLLGKDIENYKIIAGAEYKGGSSKVLEHYKNRFGDNMTDENIERFIKGLVDFNKLDVRQKLLDFQHQWGMVECEALRRLSAVFNVPQPWSRMSVYLTTNDRCGYSLAGQYFFMTVLSHSPVKVILHELLHFYTWHVFRDRLERLGGKKAYDLKESMTELLNLEFADLIESTDAGYPQHQALRELARRSWQGEKNIQKLFEDLAQAA